MNLYEAIFARQSIRKYSENRVGAGILSKVKEMTETMEFVHADIPISIHLAENGSEVQELMAGLVGSLGKVKAPHYLLATGKAHQPQLNLKHKLQNVGYALEELVLWLTTMEIGTCWLGGNLQKEALGSYLKLVDEELLVMVALGHPQENQNVFRTRGQAKRKELSTLVTGNLNKQWQTILEASRMAPSAINSQPWRFAVEGDAAHIYKAEPNFIKRHLLGDINYIDMGIAMNHMAIAANYLNTEITFQVTDHPPMAGCEYIITARVIK